MLTAIILYIQIQYQQHYGGVHKNVLNKMLHLNNDENLDNDS